MNVNSVSSMNFGKIYYGIQNEELSRTQNDVMDDIEHIVNDKGYVNKLEKLGYDIYLEPANDTYSIGVAFLKNARYGKNKELIYDKIVTIGKFVADCCPKYKFVQDACSTEQLDRIFGYFFKKESFGKYKRFLNHL